MVTFKVVIGTKDGKSHQREVADPASKTLLGKKIGDVVSGDEIGFAGYEFELKGGSDYCGFPMRKDVQGFGRKKILTVKGSIGFKTSPAKGIRMKKTVCGNAVHPKISQINLKVTKEGKEPFVSAPKTEEKK